MISLVKKRTTRFLKRNEKHGITAPNNVKEALALDKINKNTYWADTIETEMNNVRVAFRILDNEDVVPRCHNCIQFNMIFDFKM